MTVGQSSPPLLRLTSRKLLWLDLQPVDIKSRWRHNWKSAQVVNSHLVCDPTIRQPGFDLPWQWWSLLNCFCTEQDTAVTYSVLVVRPRQCPTLSNPVPWQNWMAAYLGYALRMKTLFRGWPVMVHDTHTRRRRCYILLPRHWSVGWLIISLLHCEQWRPFEWFVVADVWQNLIIGWFCVWCRCSFIIAIVVIGNTNINSV